MDRQKQLQLAKTVFSGLCFPECATVQLEDGTCKPICNIVEGDMLLSTQDGEYSRVTKMNANLTEQEDSFLTIQTEQGDIPITLNHYIHIRKQNKEEVAVDSKDVKVGDCLNFLGRFVPVTGITSTVSKGRYNPITEKNTLMVNGFLTYCVPPQQ